ALDYLFHRSSLSRAENLKAIRLWSAEERLLWSSRSGAGGSAPPPEAFREALRQGFTFRQIPPNTWYPAFQPKTTPLRLETWVALAGTEGEPPSSRFRFVVEVFSEPADLPAEVALYESRIWLISGSLGVAGLTLMLVSLSFLRRLHGTAARQAAHGMLTTKITRALSADLDPDRLFRNILQEIRQVVPCDRIVIAGVDPATREHRFWHVESDFSVPRFSGEGNREVGEWNLKHVYARMLPTNFPDLEKVDAPWVPYLLKGGLRSVFLMPILQEGEYFAHLGLSWARKGGVDPGSGALLSSLAGHLASAIRNATLFQRAERRASRLATLNALSQKIAQNIDLRETLDAIVQAAVELLGGDIARAFLQDEETGVLVPQAHAGRIPPPSAPLGTLRVGRGVIGRIVESGEPSILPDVQEVPEWQLNDWARENGLRSYVAHPLRLGGKPFGAIYCISTKAGFFTREDLDLLGSFSFQASIAIEKARLFAETRQRALRLELAGEITKALASTLRPGELFRTIAREIRRAVPCERCVIGSLDRESHRYHTWHAESEVELPRRPHLPGERAPGQLHPGPRTASRLPLRSPGHGPPQRHALSGVGGQDLAPGDHGPDRPGGHLLAGAGGDLPHDHPGDTPRHPLRALRHRDGERGGHPADLLARGFGRGGEPAPAGEARGGRPAPAPAGVRDQASLLHPGHRQPARGRGPPGEGGAPEHAHRPHPAGRPLRRPPLRLQHAGERLHLGAREPPDLGRRACGARHPQRRAFPDGGGARLAPGDHG
ncbi:MAG: GAF domain-containing protein, partial [Candidatus Tectomicrobia bacterium]|nr:GAF domain-containing protein [Candidatus Tectomicrobia bacterium]